MWGGRGAALGAVGVLPRRPRRRWRCSSARCSARRRRTCRSTSSRRSSSRRRAAGRRASGRWPSACGPASASARRPRRRVGVVARLDAAAVAGRAGPRGAILGFATAVAGALLGAWIGARLASSRRPPSRALRTAPSSAPPSIAASVGFALLQAGRRGRPRRGRADRGADAARSARCSADVTLTPRDAADDAEWLTVTAWQGGGLVVDRLERVGPGGYRTTEPIPVHGNWKALDAPAQRQLADRACRSSCPRTRRSRPRRSRAAASSRARSWPTTRSSSASRSRRAGG